MCPQARASSWVDEWLSKKPDNDERSRDGIHRFIQLSNLDTEPKKPRRLLDSLLGWLQTSPGSSRLPSTRSVLSCHSHFKLEGEERCHFPTMLDSLRQTEPEVKTELTGSQNTIKNCLSYIHQAKSH